MTNADVIHRYFRAGDEPGGHASNDRGSLSFRDGYLFSYRTAIGRLAGDEFLLLQKKFSVTTSRHQGMAAKQARAVGRAVCLVADLDA